MACNDQNVASAIKDVICCDCKSVRYMVIGAALSAALIMATAFAVLHTVQTHQPHQLPQQTQDKCGKIATTK